MVVGGPLMGNDVGLSAPLLPKVVYANVIEERKRQAEEDRIQKEEAEKKKKEEQEKKKKEAEQKKKEEEEKKKAESQEEKQERSLKTKLTEVFWTSVDVILKPVEDLMDCVLGATIDPFTDRRYIAWLSLVTLAFNYNTWFITARLCFPYHTDSAIPLWLALDTLADLIYLTDSVVFQSRKQFVKAGDIIVSSGLIVPHRLMVPAFQRVPSPSFCPLLSERPSYVQEELQRIGEIQGRFPEFWFPKQTVRVAAHTSVCPSTAGHGFHSTIRPAVLQFWIQIHFQSQSSAEGEFEAALPWTAGWNVPVTPLSFFFSRRKHSLNSAIV